MRMLGCNYGRSCVCCDASRDILLSDECGLCHREGGGCVPGARVTTEAPHVGDVVAPDVELSGAPGLAASDLYTRVVLHSRVDEGELAAGSDYRAILVSPTPAMWDRGCGGREVKCQG